MSDWGQRYEESCAQAAQQHRETHQVAFGPVKETVTCVCGKKIQAGEEALNCTYSPDESYTIRVSHCSVICHDQWVNQTAGGQDIEIAHNLAQELGGKAGAHYFFEEMVRQPILRTTGVDILSLKESPTTEGMPETLREAFNLSHGNAVDCLMAALGLLK